ncbi:MAG: PAS domain S-box protein [Actinomycetota bacterium]
MDRDELGGALLTASPDGLLLVDDAGTVVVANPAAAAIFGRPVDDLEGLAVDELVPSEHRGHHADFRDRYSQTARRRPMGTGLQLFAQHADGTLFPVEISLSPVDIDGVRHVVAAVRDVTVRQEVQAQLALLTERERIARDLHDMVIQRLFAAGMSLQAVLGDAHPPHVSSRIAGTITELDDTIRELRAAVFQLTDPAATSDVTATIAELVRDRTATMGHPVDLSIDGDFDDLPDYLAEQLVATTSEGLSNVARHAQATATTVELRRNADVLTLRIADDGIGVPERPKRNGGLSNMMWRAAELGGSCTVTANLPSGTVLSWTVPI